MPDIEVGTPPEKWRSQEVKLIHFHDFESLRHPVVSPKFSCFDHEWRLVLHPGGGKDSEDEHMSIGIQHWAGPEILATYKFVVRDKSGKVLAEEAGCKTFVEGTGKTALGCSNFVEREKIINPPSKKVLYHGTLTVEVHIKPNKDDYCKNFVPQNEFAQNMQQSFMDESTSDVIFEVKYQGEPGTGSLFHAHKVVLQFCAKGSTLASLCEDSDRSTTVPILDVDPRVFRQMLYYVYGGNIAADEWKENAKYYIDAADRYGVKNFKVEAEAWYVQHLEITLDNVIDELLYADEKNCFLLKEEATSFILKNAKEVLASESFENIPESKSIIREIVSLVAMNNHGKDEEDLNDPARLSINELRAKVYEKGKDIDAPRNRLIAQLEATSNSPCPSL